MAAARACKHRAARIGTTMFLAHLGNHTVRNGVAVDHGQPLCLQPSDYGALATSYAACQAYDAHRAARAPAGGVAA